MICVNCVICVIWMFAGQSFVWMFQGGAAARQLHQWQGAGEFIIVNHFSGLKSKLQVFNSWTGAMYGWWHFWLKICRICCIIQFCQLVDQLNFVINCQLCHLCAKMSTPVADGSLPIMVLAPGIIHEACLIDWSVFWVVCPLYNISKVLLVGSELLLLRLLVTASHEQDRRVKWPKYRESLGSNW